MLVSYYLPGNSLAPPSGLRARGDSAHTEEEQSLFDPFPYGWSPEEELGIFNTVHSPHTPRSRMAGVRVEEPYEDDQKHSNMYYGQIRDVAKKNTGKCGNFSQVGKPNVCEKKMVYFAF